MANTVKHAFQSAVTDLGVAGELGPSEWNAEHAFAGGAVGSLLYRDTGTSDGANWLAAVAAGQVLTSAGVGVVPAWSASLSITALTLSGALTVSGTGPHAIGGATEVNSVLRFTGSYGPGGTTDTRVIDIATSLTVLAGFSSEGINVRAGRVLPASGVVASVEGVHVDLINTWTPTAATVTDVAAFRVRGVTIPAGAQTVSGLLIDAGLAGGAVATYNIFSQGGTAKNRFDGMVLMATGVTAGAGTGDLILANNTGEIRGVVVAGNATYAMLSFDSSNRTSLGLNNVEGVIRDALTQVTIGANGAAAALTALPLGYLRLSLNGTAAVIPYYNA